MDKLNCPEGVQIENGNLMLSSSLPDDIFFSIDSTNVTVDFIPAQDNCANKSYTAVIENQTLNFMINKTDSCFPRVNFQFKVKASFTDNFSELCNIGKLLRSGIT